MRREKKSQLLKDSYQTFFFSNIYWLLQLKLFSRKFDHWKKFDTFQLKLIANNSLKNTQKKCSLIAIWWRSFFYNFLVTGPSKDVNKLISWKFYNEKSISIVRAIFRSSVKAHRGVRSWTVNKKTANAKNAFSYPMTKRITEIYKMLETWKK